MNCDLCNSQYEIEKFLDSLDLSEKTYYNTSLSNIEKATTLFKEIDTSQHTIEQIHKILEYKRLSFLKQEEYPFPLLLWALNTSKKIGYLEGETNSLIALAHVKRMTVPHLKEDLDHYNDALKIYRESGNVIKEIETLSNIGLNYMSLKDYDEALSMMFEVLELRKRNGQDKNIASTLHNIGDIYRHLNDTINTLKYIRSSLNYEKKYPSNSIRAMNYGFLGEIYGHQAAIDSAIYYLDNSNKIIEKYGVVPYLTVYNLNNLGNVNEQLRDYSKAYQYYKEALSIAYTKSTISKHQMIIFGSSLARILIKQNRLKEAKILLERIENKKINTTTKKAQELNQQWLIEFYQLLAQVNENENDYEAANKYNKLSIKSIEKYNHLELLKNSSELEKKYQSEIDTQNIKLLKNTNKLKQRNLIIALLGIVGLVGLLLAVFLYFKQRSRQLQIEKHTAVEKLRTKISADLHDDVGSLLTGLAMQSEILGKNAPENIKPKLNRVSELSRSAMLKMRDAVWVMDARKDNWQSLVDRINEFASEHLGALKLNYKLNQQNKSNQEEITGVTRQHLYLIAKEAIANIIKHSNADAVRIDMTKDKQEIALSIKDNGKVEHQGTAGLGVSNMKQRILELDGKLDIKTSTGYEVLIKIPA